MGRYLEIILSKTHSLENVVESDISENIILTEIKGQAFVIKIPVCYVGGCPISSVSPWLFASSHLIPVQCCEMP